MITVFILITEIRSIWEKADAKQRRQAEKVAALAGNVLTKDICHVLKEAFTEAIITAKEKEKEK